MNTGELVDAVLKDSVPLDYTRYIMIHSEQGNFPVPVDFLQALLREEHKAWAASMTRKGN